MLQFRSQAFAERRDTESQLERFKSERDDFSSQLEEAQFRVEEETINRTDIEVSHNIFK
jgi:hypothetical protein